MTDSPSRANVWLPLVLISALVAVIAWLAQGSNHQGRLPGWQAGWGTATSFNYPRRAPAAVAYNDFLYVVGGIDGHDRYVHSVEFAPIHADGSLGRWRVTSDLSVGRFYNAALAHEGYLYTLGGGAGPTGAANYPITSVERAPINTDGSLGTWQTVGELITARRGLKAVMHGKTMYAIGGYDGSFLKSTERATINDDGSLSEWTMEKHDSIIDRYIHSSAIHNNTIYLLGGHMRDPHQTSYGDVELSHVQGDQTLAPWQIEANALRSPRLVAEAFTLGSYLYIAGGHTGNERLTSVEMARIQRDGHLTPWQQAMPLPVPRSAFAVATSGRFVYALGGAGNNGPLNTVNMAAANGAGKLGILAPDKSE